MGVCPAMKVKVFGERNTGTRAAIRMIAAAHGVEEHVHPPIDEDVERFYSDWLERVGAAYSGPWRRVYRETVRDMRQEKLGQTGAWKHGLAEYHPDYAEEGIAVLFMVRDPYSWILSMHRRPYHYQAQRNVDFDIFLRRPWKCVGRDRIGPLLDTPLELWNRKVESYGAFMTAAKNHDVPTAVLRFEDFVQQPTSALKNALKCLGAQPSNLRTLAPTKPMGKKARERRYYYGQRKWLVDLVRDDVDFINSAIDWDLAQSLGYEMLDPADFALERAGLNRKAGAAATA